MSYLLFYFSLKIFFQLLYSIFDCLQELVLYIVDLLFEAVLKNKVENDEFLKKAPPVVIEKFTKKMKQKLSLKNKILTQIKS